MPNSSQRYWAQETGEWLPDQQGYVHLARATHRIGKVLFPAGSDAGPWTTLEPTRLVHRWETIDRFEVDRRRWGELKRRVADLCMRGDLSTALWTKPHGVMMPISPHYWALTQTQVDARFHWCRMNPDQPFGDGVGGDNYHTIFVSEASLERFLANRARRTTPKTTPRAKPPGNKPQFDWATFEKEAIRRLEDHGGVGATVAFSADEPGWHQGKLEAEMADWCQERWGEKGLKVPREVSIRGHVKKAMAAYLNGDG